MALISSKSVGQIFARGGHGRGSGRPLTEAMEARRLLSAAVMDVGPLFQAVDPSATAWSGSGNSNALAGTFPSGSAFSVSISGSSLNWADYGNTKTAAATKALSYRDGVWQAGNLTLGFSGLVAGRTYTLSLSSIDIGTAGSAASPYVNNFDIKVTDSTRTNITVLSGRHTATLYSIATAEQPAITFVSKPDGTASVVLARTSSSGNLWLNGLRLDDGIVVTDNTAPSAPAWKLTPYAVKAGVAGVTMVAQGATDASGVQYYFENVADPTRNSGWTDSSSWSDLGLAANTGYTYRFKVRDKSAAQNTTAWSSAASITTAADNTYAGFTSGEVGPAQPAFDFTGMRGTPRAPDVGVHPRVFTSPEELPALRDRLANTAAGRASMAQIHAYVELLLRGAANYDRSASYAVDAYGQALIGNVGFWDSSAQYAALLAYDPTNPAATNPLPFNADGTPDVTRRQVMAAQMACMAYECWVYSGQAEYDARAKDLAKAMYNWCFIEKDDPALTPTNYNLAGGIQMALAYDFNYNQMTTTQRDVVRQCIVKALWTRSMIYGANTVPQSTTSNWAALNVFVPIELMAIEGEAGYDANTFRDTMRASYKFLTYGWYGTGSPLEGLGKNYQYLATMTAFARRDYQLVGHPNVRAFATNYLPQITQPFGYAFQEYDDWGGTGVGNDQTGGYKFQIDDAVGAKWLFPNDPGADYVWQNHIGQSATGNSYYFQPIEPRGYENELIVSSIFATDFGNGDIGSKTASALKNNDTFFEPSRGTFITRSDFSTNGVKLQFSNRQDIGGHTHGDRLDFTLSGLGRIWAGYRTNATGTAFGGGLTSLAESKYASTMLIDDKGQGIDQTLNSWAPGKVVSVVDQPNASFVAGDASYAYQWLWNRQDSVQPTNDDDRIYKGFLKVGESYNTFRQTKNTDPFYDAPLYDKPDWNTPGTLMRFTKQKLLPVVYAYRTAGLVRGSRPYAVVMDDFATGDGASHDFKWQMQLPEDLSIESTTVNTDPANYRNDVVLAEAGGNRRLLVRVLQADGLVNAATPATIDTTLFNLRQDPATADRYNRLIINTKGSSTRIKVLLVPYTVGQALPTTTVNGSTYTVSMNGSTDTFDFTVGADGRTRYSLRQGASVAAQNATGDTAPAAPSGLKASAVSHTQIDLTWNANSSNEQVFRIERSTDGLNFTPIATTLAGVTTYNDTGLTAGTKYHYRVIAANTLGSAPSNVSADVAWPMGLVPVTTNGQTYTQSFNALPYSLVHNQNWTNDGWLPAWYVLRSDAVSPNTRGDAGTETTPRIFSEGAGNSTSDRAFGGMAPSNGYQAQGVLFQNQAGATVSSVDLSYAVEQWRQNVNGGSLKLFYKVQAAAPTFDLSSTTNWTAVTSLDFNAKTGTAGALDGNAAANQSAKSTTLNVNVPAGQYLWLGWRITGGNNSSNPTLAIENLSVKFNAPTPPIVLNFGVGNGTPQRSMVKSLTLSFDQPVTLSAGAIVLMRRGTSGSVNVPFTLSPATGAATVFTLTFNTQANGSLDDGVYDLILAQSAVRNASNQPMGTTTTTYSFYRLYGDFDGNGTVDFNDFLRLQNAFGATTGGSNYDAAIDGDSNGTIDFNDFLSLQNNFGRSLSVTAAKLSSSLRR